MKAFSLILFFLLGLDSLKGQERFITTSDGVQLYVKTGEGQIRKPKTYNGCSTGYVLAITCILLPNFLSHLWKKM